MKIEQIVEYGGIGICIALIAFVAICIVDSLVNR
jgi:hypothetical protein